MKKWPLFVAAGVAVATPVVARMITRRPPGAEVEPVPKLDPTRFSGTWFEIAHASGFMEKSLYGTRSTYTLVEDDTFNVSTTYRRGSPTGPQKTVEGSLRIPDPDQPSKMEVKLPWAMRLPFWVVALDKGYRWAVVSDPYRRTLWILGRDSEMDDQVYHQIVGDLARRGWDISKLRRTHRAEPPEFRPHREEQEVAPTPPH